MCPCHRYSATRFTAICFVVTFFSVFDIPVFWPILVLYFVVLFGMSFWEQVRKMIKYHYVPISLGKKTYTGKKEASDRAK